MPQQIDPNTGMPVGQGTGDLEGGQAPNFLAGLDGLPDARRVSGAGDLRAFEYLRNNNGNFYAQSALSNPAEAQQPQGIGGPPAPTGSVGSTMGPPWQQQQPQYGGGQQGGIGGFPPHLFSMLQMLMGGGGGRSSFPYGGDDYGQAENVPNIYGGAGIGYPPGPGGRYGNGLPPRWPNRGGRGNFSAAPPGMDRSSAPTGIGQPNPFQPTASGGVMRGGYSF